MKGTRRVAVSFQDLFIAMDVPGKAGRTLCFLKLPLVRAHICFLQKTP
jgi:hypothetical protein